MKSLVIIPARGGSKGLPGKNIKILNGKPLIQYTIEAAREVFTDEQICVSTDSEEIIKVVNEVNLNVPFRRPASISTDTASTYDVITHAINYYQGSEFDNVVLLQPTSPFRTGTHILEALKLYSNDIDAVVSVKETKANPYYVLKEENAEGFLVASKVGRFTRRQDCPPVYELNGAIYVMNIKAINEYGSISDFKKIKRYLMGEFESIDIDSNLDFELSELLFKETI